MKTLSVHLIAAARPNFMKIAPLYHALAREAWCRPQIVHTGQHYDANMSDAFFRDLGLPTPHFHLEVGSGTHAEQTGGVMIAYEKVAMRREARLDRGRGRRQFDRGLRHGRHQALDPGRAPRGGPAQRRPPHARGDQPARDRRDLRRAAGRRRRTRTSTSRAKACRPAKIDRVGNIMIDSFEMMRAAIEADGTRDAMGLAARQLRRRHAAPAVERGPPRERSSRWCGSCVAVSQDLPLVFAVHPRTRKKLEEFGLLESLRALPGAAAGAGAHHAHRAARLHPVHEPGPQRPGRHHRLRRRAGGEHLPRHPVPDAAREHRAADHRHRGLQSPGEARGAVRSRCRRCWRVAGRPDAGRRCGTARRPSAAWRR